MNILLVQLFLNINIAKVETLSLIDALVNIMLCRFGGLIAEVVFTSSV